MKTAIILHDGFHTHVLTQPELTRKLDYMKSLGLVAKSSTIKTLEMHCVFCIPTWSNKHHNWCYICSIVYCAENSRSHFSNKCMRCAYTHITEFYL